MAETRGQSEYMIGVVLWSDVSDEKAVFWCEDHGDLAYYDAATGLRGRDDAFQPGDMVQFDVSIERKTRRAHNPQIVQSNVCNGLMEGLRSCAEKHDTGAAPNGSTGKVIAFRRNTDRNVNFGTRDTG